MGRIDCYLYIKMEANMPTCDIMEIIQDENKEDIEIELSIDSNFEATIYIKDKYNTWRLI